MRIARRPLLACATLAALVGPRLAVADTVKGSGVAANQRREIGAFTGIALGAPFAVVVRTGRREAIEIVADDNILPLIETRVRQGRHGPSLEIELRRDARVEPRTPIVVTVDCMKIESLAVGGSGSVAAKALKAGRLDTAIGGTGAIDLPELDADSVAVAIGGSGSFRADGRAGKLSVMIGGSGRCDAERLVAGEVAVSVAGSGSARVNAQSALSVSIAGSGDVWYRGAATPQTSIVGSGRLRPI